MIEEI